MDSCPGDEALLLAVAERDFGVFRMLYERHAGWLAGGAAVLGFAALAAAAGHGRGMWLFLQLRPRRSRW